MISPIDNQPNILHFFYQGKSLRTQNTFADLSSTSLILIMSVFAIVVLFQNIIGLNLTRGDCNITVILALLSMIPTLRQ